MRQSGVLFLSTMIVALGCARVFAIDGTPLALVLSGGGAKGAYEVGVWKELEESGLAPRVKAISGTSVGAINAALFATRPKASETLWLENMKDVFSINSNRVGASLQKSLDQMSDAIDQYNKVRQTELYAAAKRLGVAIDALPAEEIEAAEKTARRSGWGNLLLSLSLRISSDIVDVELSDSSCTGYIDSSRLVAVLDANLPKDWPADAPVVYATAVEKGAGKASQTWQLNGEPHDRRVLMISASAAIPVAHDTVSIDGKTYVDGGWESKGGDNVPLVPILENHPNIKTAIIVYLDDEKHLPKGRLEKNRDAAKKAGVRLVEIIPSENIGGAFNGWQGVFDSSPDTARKLIALGREDARRALELN